MSDKDFVDTQDEREAPAFSDPEWEHRHEEYRSQRRKRLARRRSKSGLDKELEDLWTEHGSPSRHSSYDNLIPIWQKAVKRFARAVLRDREHLLELLAQEEEA